MDGIGGRTRLVVVTDLDGTLLDAATYAHEPARDALDALTRRDIPLVLATSKTRPEIARLAATLPVRTAWIVENGGAVIVPAGFAAPEAAAGRRGRARVLRLGRPRAELVAHLRDIAAETGRGVRGFVEMPVEEVARLTGLDEADARLARRREFDEPFLLEHERDLPVVQAAAERRGLTVTRGGRFHHVAAGSDKGRALRVLLGRMAGHGPCPWTIGLGDAANDLPFLRIVDEPVLVPRPDGTVDPALASALPRALRAPYPGPAGWNAAVLAILERLERQSTAGPDGMP